MAALNPFSIPTNNSTLPCTTSSARVAMAVGGGSSLLVKNIGAVECFIAVGDSTVTVTAGQTASAVTNDGGMSIPAGEVGIYEIPNSATHVAGITASGSTTLRISRSEGQ